MAAIVRPYLPNDSNRAKFMKAALALRGAATLTKKKMGSTFDIFCYHAKKHRWGDFEPATLTFKQLNGYVAARLEAGIGPRSLQNEMSHIRRALEGVGRKDFAQKVCSNNQLQIPKGTRIGTGKVIVSEVLANALNDAPDNTKALIKLSRYLGLREREAVMSGDSINEWERALLQGQPITVRNGTKGGRIRDVFVIPGNREKALLAVQAAQIILQRQEYLVVSKNLKAAVEQHSDRLAKLGLKGENSCHSLRRAFAMDQYNYYLAEGCSDKVALVRTANDLGHGKSRGRWVYNNYLRATLEGETSEEKA